ncbi:unnamed protein product [Ixodes persulcatus]
MKHSNLIDNDQQIPADRGKYTTLESALRDDYTPARGSDVMAVRRDVRAGFCACAVPTPREKTSPSPTPRLGLFKCVGLQTVVELRTEWIMKS